MGVFLFLFFTQFLCERFFWAFLFLLFFFCGRCICCAAGWSESVSDVLGGGLGETCFDESLSLAPTPAIRRAGKSRSVMEYGELKRWAAQKEKWVK